MEVKKGQILTLKPEWIGPNEVDPGKYIALEDSWRGTVRVQALDSKKLIFNPVNDWHVDWIATAE